MPGVWLAPAGHLLATAILAGLAAAVWLVLTWGVPASLLLTRERDTVLGSVKGAWLLWVGAAPSPSRSQARAACVTGGLRWAASLSVSWPDRCGPKWLDS